MYLFSRRKFLLVRNFIFNKWNALYSIKFVQMALHEYTKFAFKWLENYSLLNSEDGEIKLRRVNFYLSPSEQVEKAVGTGESSCIRCPRVEQANSASLDSLCTRYDWLYLSGNECGNLQIFTVCEVVCDSQILCVTYELGYFKLI